MYYHYLLLDCDIGIPIVQRSIDTNNTEEKTNYPIPTCISPWNNNLRPSSRAVNAHPCCSCHNQIPPFDPSGSQTARPSSRPKSRAAACNHCCNSSLSAGGPFLATRDHNPLRPKTAWNSRKPNVPKHLQG